MSRDSFTRLMMAVVLGSFIFLLGSQQVFAQDNYGAIAYSRSSGSHGYSYDYATRRAAETRALRECESYSGTGDCEILVWFKNGCGALAKSPSGAFGSGWGVDRDTAEYYALRTCSKYGSGCEVIRWVCTGR